MDNGSLINYAISLLMRKTIVPLDYHSQCEAVQEIMQDDVSGLIDSLTDFQVQSASVDFSVESSNNNFSKILKKWLENINKDYRGRLPTGIDELAKEYYKERWKGSSFCALKIMDWARTDGNILVPTKMAFVDGGSIQAEDKDKNENNIKTLSNYNYYLGTNQKNKLDKNVIFSRPYSRWFDKYPTPYLIKRGVYHNWSIVKSLKKKQTEVLEQILPYLLFVQKGSEALAVNNIKTYSNTELQNLVNDFKELMTEVKTANLGDKNVKTPIRVTQFDETIKHLIPDLTTLFNEKLFANAERSILSGLGFIDVISSVSDSRKESVLNPKAFVVETKSGIEDFKQIIKQLVFMIQDKNKGKIKYMNTDFYITSSPVKAFMTDKFKSEARMLWKHGQLSNQSYCELVGEISYKTEIFRREKEAKDGTDVTMRPHMTDNREGVSEDIPGEKPVSEDEDKNGNPIDDNKKEQPEKYEMSKLELEGSPYPTIKSLPDSVKEKLSPSKQRAWMKIWNNSYKTYLKKFGDETKAETYAFRTAWSQIKQIKK